MRSAIHLCNLPRTSSGSTLPPLPANASIWRKFKRHIRKITLISDNDPRIIEYYRTKTGLINEKRRQIESRYHYMIHPFSTLNNTHEALMCLIYLICFVLYPVNFVYRGKNVFEFDLINAILSLTNILCMTDICLKLFTGFIEQKSKVAILDQPAVIKHYVFGPYFVFDFLSSLPTDIVGYFAGLSVPLFYIHCLRLLKVVRFCTFLNCFHKAAFFANWNGSLLMFVYYTMFIFLMVHWFACARTYLPRIRRHVTGSASPYSWTVNKPIYSVASLHRISCGGISGLLLGAYSPQRANYSGLAAAVADMKNKPNTEVDLGPFNNPIEEVVFDGIVMFLGKFSCAAFAVIIITRIFEKYTLETKYEAMLNQLHEFMMNRKLPMAMRERVVQYYEHRYQKKYFREEVISGLLSENLRKDININVLQRLINVVNIFSELPQDILSEILANLREEVYLPNDVIIKAGTPGHCMYFLASGTVAVYTPSGREVCHLQDGAYFGEIALILKNMKRTTDIIAIEVCEVYRLDKKAFVSCFKHDKYGIFNKMQHIAEQRFQKTSLLEEAYKIELFQKAYGDIN